MFCINVVAIAALLQSQIFALPPSKKGQGKFTKQSFVHLQKRSVQKFVNKDEQNKDQIILGLW